MMKVLAIDYGDVRIGLAISDEKGIFSFPEVFISAAEKRKI